MSILGGLDFIARQQRKDGGFWEYNLSLPGEMTRPKYRTTFTPSLVALALANLPRGRRIRQKCVEFLLAQKSTSWSWNYWARSSAQTRLQAYPDDLDDTFLALCAIWHYDQSFIAPSVSAEVAHLLFATETQPGGPYRTWLVDNDANEVWRDVDPAVNANIGAFLALQDVELPALTTFLETAVAEQKLISPYYPTGLPITYFMSRWYRGKYKERLQDLILLEQKDATWESPHQTALAVSALIRLGYPAGKLKAACQSLRMTQAADGGWPPEPMCIGPGGQLSGSAALTTALCIEALTLYQHAVKKPRPSKSPAPPDRHYDIVVNTVRDHIATLGHTELKLQTHAVLERIISRDHDRQIVRLPLIIAQASAVRASEDLTRQLAVANVWGWMAYMVYDDFLDNEGDPRFLPSAVYAHRQLFESLRATLPGNRAFHDEIAAIMDRLDQANAWEVAHCRASIKKGRLFIDKLPEYGDYWQLADRSLGHAIAGIGVLYDAGVSAQRIQALVSFFEHYLIARQLNDDAHDWESDLARGHINAAAAKILEIWSAKHRLAMGIDPIGQSEALRLIMWEQVIDSICHDIASHIAEAKSALGRAGMDDTVVLPLLMPLENAAKKALSTRDDSLEFISRL